MTESSPPSGGLFAGRDRRTLVLGGALAAVVLTAGGWSLLSGGDEPEVVQVASSVARAPRAAATPAPAVPAPEAPLAVRQGGDPFLALVPPAAVEVASGAATTTTGTTGTPTTTTTGTSTPATGAQQPAAAPVVTRAPAAPAAPRAAPAPAPTATRAPAPTATATRPPTATPTATATATPGTYPLRLLAVGAPAGGSRSTVWTVDGTRVSVLPGQRFGKAGELVVLKVTDTTKGVRVVLQVGSATPVTVGVGSTLQVG